MIESLPLIRAKLLEYGMFIKRKQRGIAAIEYAILIVTMSVLLFFFFGSDGALAQAVKGAYQVVVDSIKSA